MYSLLDIETPCNTKSNLVDLFIYVNPFLGIFSDFRW